jgi:hypothetical protein
VLPADRKEMEKRDVVFKRQRYDKYIFGGLLDVIIILIYDGLCCDKSRY